MSLNLKEFIEKTRFDTGITTDEMIQEINRIKVEETLRFFDEDSKKGGNSMMIKMFEEMMKGGMI